MGGNRTALYPNCDGGYNKSIRVLKLMDLFTNGTFYCIYILKGIFQNHHTIHTKTAKIEKPRVLRVGEHGMHLLLIFDGTCLRISVDGIFIHK